MKKLALALLIMLLFCPIVYGDGPELSREKWRFAYDSPNGWLFVSIWPERPWLDCYEFFEVDGGRVVLRLLRVMKPEDTIVDVANLDGMILVVVASEETATVQLFSPYTNLLLFDRIIEKPFLKRINL